VFKIKFLANKSNATIRMALDAYMYRFKKMNNWLSKRFYVV